MIAQGKASSRAPPWVYDNKTNQALSGRQKPFDAETESNFNQPQRTQRAQRVLGFPVSALSAFLAVKS
jgi:hypothetical protein